MTRLALVALASLALTSLATSCTVRAPASVDGPDAHVDATVDAFTTSTACRVDAECNDRFGCTVDHCTDGLCDHVPCTDCCGPGFMCDAEVGCTRAADPCTVDSECMDDQPCTLDRCRDGRVCEHQPTDSLCPFGQICLAAAGCIPQPPDACVTPEDCEVVGYCVGTWDCATELGCAYVGPRDCDDGDDCTRDRCDGEAGACAHDAPDADGDRHVDDVCRGDDCDDTVASTYPGATEACNGTDDDCDARIDEGCCASGPCTTACGTTGMTSCNPDGTVGPCMPPAELCDGSDQDCDGDVDEDFECARGASTACTTACGSTGAASCDATCHVGACVAPPEACNALDDDCDGAPDDGFACVRDSSTTCPTTCGSTGSRLCGGACTYDLCAPPPETCNGADDDCDSTCDDGFACCAGSARDCRLLGFFAGSALCRSDCTGFDMAACTNCGNGARDAGEACDGVALGGETCATRGFATGTLRCAAGCVYDTSSCSNCGNGVRNTGEACDGTDLGGMSCASLGTGFGSGTLRCGAACAYDTSGCSTCGNGALDVGEECDGSLLGGQTCLSIPGGFTGGTLRCGAGCRRDTSSCTLFDPSGFYGVAPAPSYSCLGGLFSYSFSGLTFIDSGSSLTVNGAPCTMTGPSARASRMIDVQCTISGGCPENYHLVATYSTDQVWSGTFTATLGPGSCGGCATRSFSVTGTR